MNTGADEQIGHALYQLHRQAQLGGELLGILAVADIDAAEKCLAVFPVFGAGVHVVHKAVFRSVEFGGEIGHLS